MSGGDCDRGDYLLRDSHYTGVSYGVYDLPRLMATLTVLDGPDGPELGMDIHGVHVLESLLLLASAITCSCRSISTKHRLHFEYYLQRAIVEGEISLDLRDGISSLVGLRDDSITRSSTAARTAEHAMVQTDSGPGSSKVGFTRTSWRRTPGEFPRRIAGRFADLCGLSRVHAS